MSRSVVWRQYGPKSRAGSERLSIGLLSRQLTDSTGTMERMFGAVCVAQAVLLASVLLACEEDMGQDEWLIVDNRTDSLVVIVHIGDVALQVGAVGAGGRGYVGGTEFCDAIPLQARRNTVDGPLVDTRPPSDGEACIKTWVIEPD